MDRPSAQKKSRFVRALLRAGGCVALAVGVYFFIGISFPNTKADTQVIGSGTPGFVAQWIVQPPPAITSCGPSPAQVRAGQTAVWSADAIGGAGGYAFLWSGDAPLNGSTANPTYVVYTTIGTKSGSVMVTSGAQSITKDCGSMTVLPGIISFAASPIRITSSQTSTLSWNTTGFSPGSCAITADQPGQGIGQVDTTPGTHSQTRSPSQKTVYTLTCTDSNGSQAQNATVDVVTPFGTHEIAPQ